MENYKPTSTTPCILIFTWESKHITTQQETSPVSFVAACKMAEKISVLSPCARLGNVDIIDATAGNILATYCMGAPSYVDQSVFWLVPEQELETEEQE